MKEQKKVGVVLSYINICLSMSINVVLTPILITALSDETYSIYKIIQSFSGPLAMFSIGISGMTTRYIAKYRADAEVKHKEKENVLAMILIVAIVMAAMVLTVSWLLKPGIDKLYGAAYSKEQIDLANILYSIFSVSASVNIITDIFRGCVDGHEKFAVHYGVNILHSIIKLLGSIWCVNHGASVIGIALVGLLDSIAMLAILLMYTLCVEKEKFILHTWDRREFKVMLVFAGATFLQVLVNQVNNNLDIALLGVFVEEKRIITMYSAALSIFSIYNSLLSVTVGVFLPKTVFVVEKLHTREELTNYLIAPGRIQATIAVGMLIGFLLFGEEFIHLWIGSTYKEAYYLALILMIPATIPLVENACLNVLDAKLKRMFRSVVLCLMAVANLLLSVWLIRIFGFWGAALGTAISFVVGHGLIMNIYYKRSMGIQVFRMFKEMFRGIAWCGLTAYLICFPLRSLKEYSLISFAIKCIMFVMIYAVLLWLKGWNENEKHAIQETF